MPRKPYPTTPKPDARPVPTRGIYLGAPLTMPLNFSVQVEVRTYPNLADATTYTEHHYSIGALVSDHHGVYALALERETDDGRTEVLRLRLVSAEE